MSDMFNLEMQPPLNKQVFVALSDTAVGITSPFCIWRKPRGTRLTSFFLLGAGNRGGNGFTRTAGSAGGGGGGGGSGGIARAIFLNDMLPDELYVYVGGGAGSRSYIMLPNITAFNGVNAVLCSGNADATAGGTGTAGAAGAAGAASTVASVANCLIANLALSVMFVAGVAGVLGGAQTGAVGVSKTLDNIISGGAGGAGCTTTDFAGGAITAAGVFPGLIAGTAAGGHGLNGYSFDDPHMLLPFTSTGGSGGGSNNSGVGGNGGSGGRGSGGAGGGAGATGGTGGNGGPGYGMAVSW